MAKTPGAKTPSRSEFPAIFTRLKAILTPYAQAMVVLRDESEWYYLNTKSIGANKQPIGFAAVRIGKAYVSFYLMPIYMNEKLQAQVSPALQKRKQGKACFNFTTLDEALFAELEGLGKGAYECFQNLGYA